MPYAAFTLERVEREFGLIAVIDNLFPELEVVREPDWLRDLLARGHAVAAFVSEKARSEYIVAPVLLACRDLVPGAMAIYSGQRLDVDDALELIGECDFILALTQPVPRLRAPLVTLLEAKRGDIELGLGQCAAQMVGARLFNEKAGEPARAIFGVVTTGEDWQFLRLEGPTITLHRDRLFIADVGKILAALRAALTSAIIPSIPHPIG